MQARGEDARHAMTATATHDTKRGEDARMRVLAIAELRGDWIEAVKTWQTLNARFAENVKEVRAPSLGAEYMLYQTLVGAWPTDGVDESFVDRIEVYAIKAAREGKVDTSWINPEEAYESALKRFVHRMLDPSESSEFIASFTAFARRAALIGALNSLSQLTLKATMPGVPDFYQGTEFWDLSLVDPDNRRPVDFAARATLLASLGMPDWTALTKSWRNGHLKLAWTANLLKLRAELADVFPDGDYQPLAISGRHRDHIIAFARRKGSDAAIVAVARHFAPFTEGGRVWPGATAFDGAIDLTGSGLETATVLTLSALFTHLPAAVVKAKV